MEIVFEEHIGLVKSIIINKFCGDNNVNFSFDELMSFGYEGLLKAIKDFDSSKNIKFSTFAHVVIFRTIYDNCKKDRWVYEASNSKKARTKFKSLQEKVNSFEKKDTTLEETLISDENFVDEIVRRDLSSYLAKNIDRLEETLKQILVAYYFEGYKQSEIATLINASPSYVNQKIVQARKKLYLMLKDKV